MSAPQQNPNTGAPPAAGGSNGQEDYVDKGSRFFGMCSLYILTQSPGLDAIEKKFGQNPQKLRSMNEKVTDAGRGFFEKMTGKKVPEKYSN